MYVTSPGHTISNHHYHKQLKTGLAEFSFHLI